MIAQAPQHSKQGCFKLGCDDLYATGELQSVVLTASQLNRPLGAPLTTPETPPEASPFDRIGLLALAWAGGFMLVAAALSFLLG